MPKSYELKLREAEERRRPKPKEEVYKAVEGVTKKILMGYDHPECISLEMQNTFIEDTWTIDRLFDHLFGEVNIMDVEYRRERVHCNYSKKYLWYDRYHMRPRCKDTEFTCQDYELLPGFRMRMAPGYEYENMWGEPVPHEPELERPLDQMDPCEDKNLLRRLDSGPPTTRIRLFCFPFIAGNWGSMMALAQRVPKDWGVYMLSLPNHEDRLIDEVYPTGEFACEVFAKTLVREMRKPGANFFFGHLNGSHFAFYTAKILQRDYGMSPKAMFVSNFGVPSCIVPEDLGTLQRRSNCVVPLRILSNLVKGGWGVNPQFAYKSHMGHCSYQTADCWNSAKPLLTDHWLTMDFPLSYASEPVDCPIHVLYGKDDDKLSAAGIMEWKRVTSKPEMFEMKKFEGGRHWFLTNAKSADEMADFLSASVGKLK